MPVPSLGLFPRLLIFLDLCNGGLVRNFVTLPANLAAADVGHGPSSPQGP